jgi:adenosylcobyric acid synthase
VVILPGSKHVAADLAWLRESRLDAALEAALDRGTRVIGVCGGAMMMGEWIADPHGAEGRGGDLEGLGLIALSTEMERGKTTIATQVRFRSLPVPWAALSGRTVDGYEIRYGNVTGQASAVAVGAWAAGGVLATTVHGLFEDPDIVQAVFGVRPPPVLEATYDQLANAIEEHLDTALLRQLVGLER